MQRIFHTPEGVRDIYSSECTRKRTIQEKLHHVFHQYGYEDKMCIRDSSCYFRQS